MPNIGDPRVAASIDECWAVYRDGLLFDVAQKLGPASQLFQACVPDMDVQSASNAAVELAMLEVICTMVTAEGQGGVIKTAEELTSTIAQPGARCDDLHRLGAFAVGVHAAMRTGRLDDAERWFRQALAMAQGLVAEGGEEGAGIDDVCTVLGCAGLHLAQTAAVCGDASTSLGLLEQSLETAAQLGREHDVLGQYFGPQHVRAMRSLCLALLGRLPESVEAGREVDLDALIPLMRTTLLRCMAETLERVEEPGRAAVLYDRADRVAPPLRRQFGVEGEPEG